MEFENVEDRDYYAEKDPVHRSFIDSLGPFVAGAQVIDFVPGVFWDKDLEVFEKPNRMGGKKEQDHAVEQ